MLFKKAFSEVLQSSLFFSDILSTYNRIFVIGVQKSDRYLNKNQVSVAIRRYKSLSGKHQSLSSSSPYYNICKTFCIRTLLSLSAYPCVSILHGHFFVFCGSSTLPSFFSMFSLLQISCTSNSFTSLSTSLCTCHPSSSSSAGCTKWKSSF